MYRFLLRPRWIAATSTVILVSALFVNLGLWQLSRHDERVVENAVRRARIEAEPVALEALLEAAGDDLDSLEYRRAVAVGTFEPDDEVLWRGRVAAGIPGFDVVTPLRLSSGDLVLVDRGWVPLNVESVPVPMAPPEGTVHVGGVVRLGQAPTRVGPVEPEGTLVQIARVDLDRLGLQFENLTPLWLQITEADSPMGDTRLPPPPDFDDDGPHMEYALQWFAFAVIGVVGFGLLIRRAARKAWER